ncbi:hypothetical protein NDU88_010078, partial [Pleurodeles waltl]
AMGTGSSPQDCGHQCELHSSMNTRAKEKDLRFIAIHFEPVVAHPFINLAEAVVKSVCYLLPVLINGNN